MTFKETNNRYLLEYLGGEYLASIRHMRILMNNMDNGGFWGYGQVLYVNPSKNMIAVYLGADRLKDFDILFEQLSTYLN